MPHVEDNVIGREKAELYEFEPPPAVPAELVAFAECELNETPLNRVKCIYELRHLLQQEEGLRSRTDAAFLLRFLRPAKFNVQRALRMIKRYYKLRLDAHSTFKNRFTPRDQLPIFEHKLVTILPQKDAEGRSLFLIRTGAWDPRKVCTDDYLISILLMMELCVRDVETSMKGAVVIIDMMGLSMIHVQHLTPVDLRHITTLIQDCFPCRIKAIHIINQPMLFSIIWNIIRPFLSLKLSRRMHLHGFNLKHFYKAVDQRYLPTILGGTETLDSSSQVRELLAMNDNLFYDGAYGYTDLTAGYKPIQRS